MRKGLMQYILGAVVRHEWQKKTPENGNVVISFRPELYFGDRHGTL